MPKAPLEAAAKAKWIWYDHERNYDLINARMQARRAFTLKSVPKKCVIGVTADTRYRLYVNGEYVCRGPARGFQSHWPYDEVDIAPYLRKGKNVLAAVAHNLGISTYRYLHQGFAGLLVWGRAGGKPGGVDLATGPDWRVRPAPGYRRVRARLSVQQGFQEHYDARAEGGDGSWVKPAYSERDADWRKPWCLNFGCMPWHSLEPRGIPLFREELAAPVGIVSESSGWCDRSHLEQENLVRLYLDEKMKWRASDAKAARSAEWTSFEVPAAGGGRYHAFCVDFGREVAGSIRIGAAGAAGGEIVDYIVTEAVDGHAPVMYPPEQQCHMAFGNRLVLRAGATEHEMFDYWGFRYCIVIVRNSRRKMKLKVGLRSVGYPLDVKAAFESDNEKLDGVYRMSAWTQQLCMFDAYVDCPWREQAQWWGDARVQAYNTFYLSADARLLARGIRQIGAQTAPNGLTYGHAPTIAHHCILPDFTLTWIGTHWDYYWQTGDISLWKEMSGVAEEAFEYFSDAESGGLLPYDDRYWLFLDWAAIFKDGYPTLYNMLYVMALRYAAELSKLAGDRKRSRDYAARARRSAKAVETKLYDRKRREFYGGLSWKKKPVRNDTPHAYALALLLDLVPAHADGFAERLLSNVRGDHDHPVQPSPFYMYYILEALKRRGHGAEVVDCVERWWGDMIDRGLTTCEEGWNATAGQGSLCHAWSAHPIVHLSNIMLGVRQTAPAWKEILFSPTFTHAQTVKGKVATPHGPVGSEWRVTDGVARVTLKLPKEITARVELPGCKTKRLRGPKKASFDVVLGG